ncbi:MAG: ABC transporter permease [Eubacteriales bacterium]
MLQFLKNPWFIIKENFQNLGRTFEMSVKELNKKYSGAAMGAVWALVKPMLFIFVYWFAISVGIRGGKAIDGGHPFILWLVAGIIPWFYISEVLVYAGTSYRQNRHLITKMVYPISTIPTFRVLSQLYVHITIVMIIIVIMATQGYMPDVYYFQLIYYIICIFVFMMVLSWITAPLVVVSRDFEHLIKSITQMLFWLTPIIWQLDNIGENHPLVKNLVMANPIYYFVKGYRDTFINKEWFWENMKYTGYFWIVILILAFVGAYIYNKLKDELADIL